MATRPRREKRRGARIDGHFLVEVVGIDEAPRPRTGNISVSGVYFESEGDFGERRWPWRWASGTMERLRMSSASGEHPSTAFGCLIRRITIHDVWEERAHTGLAYQFVAIDEAEQVKLNQLVRATASAYVWEHNSPLDALGLSAAITGSTPESIGGRLHRLYPSRLVVETTRACEPGSQVQVEVLAAHNEETVRFDGTVIEASPIASRLPRFYVSVEVAGGRLRQKLESLMDALVAPDSFGTAARIPRVQGSLVRVPAQAAATLMEREALTGTLVVKAPLDKIRLVYQRGTLVDVVSSEPYPSVEAVMEAMAGWKQGGFVVELEPEEAG